MGFWSTKEIGEEHNSIQKGRFECTDQLQMTGSVFNLVKRGNNRKRKLADLSPPWRSDLSF